MDLLAAILSILALIVAFKNRSDIKALKSGAKFGAQERVKSNLRQESAVKGLRHEVQAATAQSHANNTNSSEGWLSKWLKENTLMKAGIFFLVLAFVWLLRLAYVSGYIGPYTVIVFALVVSAAVLLFGFYDAMKNLKRGISLLALGTFMALATVFAARFVYDMFSSGIAFAMAALPLAFSSFAAYRFNSSRLAGFVYFLAAATPFLVKSDTGSFFGLFSYLLIINLATLALIAFKKWHFLVFEAFAATVVYSLVAAFSFNVGVNETLFAFAFGLLFAVVSFVALVKESPENKKAKKQYLSLALSNTVFVAVWTWLGLPEDLHSAVFLFWSFVFLVLGFAGFAVFSRKSTFYVFSSSALLFLGFVTVNELDFEVLLAAFSIELALATFVTYFMTRNADISLKTLRFYIVPLLVSGIYFLGFLDGQFETFSPEALSTYLFIAVSVSLAYFVQSIFKESKEAQSVANALYAVSGLWLLALVWFIPHAELYSYGFATFVSIAIYTVIGLALYFNNFKTHQELLHKVGAGILVMVAARVLLIDVWDLSLLYRIVVFATVGLALVATAYRVSHLKGKTEGVAGQEKEIKN